MLNEVLNIISSFSAALSIPIAFLSTQKNKYNSISNQRLKSVYNSLISELTDIMFSYSNSESFKNKMSMISDLVLNNRAYAGNKVYNRFRKFTESGEEKKSYFFNEFCEAVLAEYNEICSDVGLNKISAAERLENGWIGNLTVRELKALDRKRKLYYDTISGIVVLTFSILWVVCVINLIKSFIFLFH